MKKQQSRKIVRYRKPIHLNIGVIIFGIIFIYIVFCVFNYVTSEHISAYQVEQGKLARDNYYRGFIIREEEVVYTDIGGNIKYYTKEGEKVSVGSNIYTLDTTGTIETMLNTSTVESIDLLEEQLIPIRKEMSNFTSTYNNNKFGSVYDLKYDLENSLLEMLNLNAISMLGEDLGNFQAYTALKPGIIVYATDGYEGVTPETFQSSYLKEDDYNKINFKDQSSVDANSPVYKLLKNENWSIIIELQDAMALELAEETHIEIEFQKDQTRAWTDFSIFQQDGKSYALLKMKNSMVRYATDRYIDIKLLLNEKEGLKIPMSAITEKDFYTIPIAYATKGGNKNVDGLLIESFDEDGIASTQFEEITFYYKTDDVYYVDIRDFDANDKLVKPDSDERYSLQNKASLIGIYNINKGYAVFKQINILYQNAEYCIVEGGTDFGIALYDHIALDSTVIEEDDIIQ